MSPRALRLTSLCAILAGIMSVIVTVLVDLFDGDLGYVFDSGLHWYGIGVFFLIAAVAETIIESRVEPTDEWSCWCHRIHGKIEGMPTCLEEGIWPRCLTLRNK